MTSRDGRSITTLINMQRMYKSPSSSHLYDDLDLSPLPCVSRRDAHKSRSRSAERIRDVLEENYVSDVMHESNAKSGGGRRQPRRPVVELDSHMTPLEAARVLLEGNIFGAPVWDQRQTRYVGIFDMRAILWVLTAGAWAVERNGGVDTNGSKGDGINTKSSPKQRVAGEFRSILISSLKELDEKEHPTIEKIASLHRFYSCTPQTSIADMCRVISMMGCHRMPVVQNGRVSYILSQTAMVDFLDAKLGRRGLDGVSDELDETLDDAGLEYRKDVVCIRDTASASQAFGMLVSHRLSGLAVVDGEGRLVEATSAKDIKRAAVAEERTAMDTTILEYLSKVRQGDGDGAKSEGTEGGGHGGSGPPCQAYEDVTLGKILSMLALAKQHRVFVTDKEKRPVGVISVTDIISFALGLHNTEEDGDC